MKNNIILIGFMGSGKTSVAIELKKISKFKILETDKLIEEKNNLSINEIFKTYGEEYFRNEESQILKLLLHIKKSIISTGGGIILKYQNQSILKRMGLIFWLDAKEEIFYQRLKNDSSRPLLAENKFKKIMSLLKTRTPIYANMSDYKINTSLKSPAQIAEEIWDLYQSKNKFIAKN